jgi:hypothetical protein
VVDDPWAARASERRFRMTVPYNEDKRRKRIPCAANDGSGIVIDLVEGGLVNFQTTHGHYVAIGNEDLKALVLFLMGHIFPNDHVCGDAQCAISHM